MRKGSLSLSVNAIVVFILAFAMLGVGIYFINLMREQITADTLDVFDANKLKNQPTAEEPITLSSDITMKGGETKGFDLGFYNKDSTAATDARPVITECYGDGKTDDPADTKKPVIISGYSTVPPYESKGFPIKIKSDSGLNKDKTWVCNLEMQKDDGTEIYESTTFFFNIAS